MRTTFQIIAVLLTVAFTTSVWFGSGWLFDRMGFDFALGAMFMLALVLLVYFVSNWLDKTDLDPGGLWTKRSVPPDATRPGEHQRPRHTIDL